MFYFFFISQPRRSCSRRTVAGCRWTGSACTSSAPAPRGPSGRRHSRYEYQSWARATTLPRHFLSQQNCWLLHYVYIRCDYTPFWHLDFNIFVFFWLLKFYNLAARCWILVFVKLNKLSIARLCSTSLSSTYKHWFKKNCNLSLELVTHQITILSAAKKGHKWLVGPSYSMYIFASFSISSLRLSPVKNIEPLPLLSWRIWT